MRAKHLFIRFALSLAASGAVSAQKVNIDYDKTANFQDYKTCLGERNAGAEPAHGPANC